MTLDLRGAPPHGAPPMRMSLEPRTERPPEGLARGRWEAPAWAIVGLGLALLGAAVAFWVMRARRVRPRTGPDSRRRGAG
ncbi:MAG: hypothetical protein WKG00_06345 [Polyangiaceae bacterium]